MSQTDVNIKSNATIAKALDLGQRLFSLFLANALPAIAGGAVIGVSVAKAASVCAESSLVRRRKAYATEESGSSAPPAT